VSIVSRDSIRAKARSAFLAGKSRDDHGMNPGSAALHDWLTEYDLMALNKSSRTRLDALPLNQNAPSVRNCVEQEQGHC